MSGRNIRALGGRTSRLRIRGRGRGRIIRGVRGMRGFRGRIRQRGDFGKVNLRRSESNERDYAMLKEESYKMKHYSERSYGHDEISHYHYRSRSRTRSRSRSRSRSISRSPYRRYSHHRHYSRSRSRSYSPRRRSRSISRSLSRSPPRRHKMSPRRPESSLERKGPPRKLQEENRNRELIERFQSRPSEKYVKQPVKKEVKVVKEQVKAVKEQVKVAKEQVKIMKEQFKKMVPLPEVTKKESPPPMKEPMKLPVTIRDMPIYSDDESDNDLDSRLRTPQTKKEERFKFETDVGKDIRSQLLERAMIEKKKLGLENPGAAEKSSALEALQCYSPETHSPSPTSQHNYESHNIQIKKNPKKRKPISQKDPLKAIFKSNDGSSSKTECLPSIPGLGFSSIEDEEKFLYGDDDEKDNEEKYVSGGDDDDDEEEEDDDVNDINTDSGSNIIKPEVKPNIKAEAITRSMIKANVVESNDWSSNNVNLPLQDIPSKRRRLLTSGSDDNMTEYTRSKVMPKPYVSPTVHHEIIERKYSASGMIDLQLPDKLRQNVKDSPSEFIKRSLSSPVMKVSEKGNRLEFSPQFEVKPSLANRRKDTLEERRLKHQSPSGDFERTCNKSEKYFHSALSSRRSKREESPPRKEHIPRFKSRQELYEEASERKHRERNRKNENLRTEERTRDWEDSPRCRTPDRSPWRSPEERKKWDSYREYSRSPRNLSLERSSCHSRSPREPYYDRSPSHSPRRWSSPRREMSLNRWSPRRELSPRKDDSPNAKSREWQTTSHKDHYYDRWHSPSHSPDERQSSRSPSWNKEYKNSYQQQTTQSFDTSSVETYTTSQQPSNINAEPADTTSSYTVPQQSYYQPVYPSVNPHMTYSAYNTTQFPQTASYNAPFQSTPISYMNIPPTGYPPAVIQIQQQPPPTRAQENITRTNLTVIPLQSETQKLKETKHVFTMLEDERKKSETGKRTFVTISDYNQMSSIDYNSFSYKQLMDKRAEKKKHLLLLQNEMAKLCKMQGEMMRKKQKEKDGHKDALIVENTKLQEEVSNQIQESKQELLQIKQAIRKYFKEAEKEEEEKKLEKQQKRLEQERREEQDKEQNQRQYQKIHFEEKAEDVSDDLLDNETNFNFKYFDPGNHWCKLCNEVNTSIFKLFEHLHSSKHRQKMDPCDRPWADQKKWSEKSVGGQTIAAPIKGVQFLVPLEGFYCSICKELLSDAISAEEHLKSTSHNQNYMNYILLNPFYERRWNLDKAAGISVAEKEEKKRQKEISIEAKIKKREEAERRHKELIKNEKAREVKRLNDIPVTKSFVEKEKSKPKAIRLTLLGDKGKLAKQKKEEKMLPPKETKPVPVIYIGKAPNFRSMAYKQDTSGFGKFNWKKDENEIVPEDQTSVPEDFKPKQEDEKSKTEEIEPIKEKPKNFPLRKNKKPQLNIVYGPEPPPDLHLRESSQAPTTPEKTDDGMLPSEMDIAQAFAGKFEGNEEPSAKDKTQDAVEDTVINRSSNASATFLIIDEIPSEQDIFYEEIKPAITPVGRVPTGPSRQMMLMLKSVENMSKEAQSNIIMPKIADSIHKQQSALTTTENSQLANKPIVAVTRNISRIQPMQIVTALKPPGEEDSFFTENTNIRPPPPKPPVSQSENKPRVSLMRSENILLESTTESTNKPLTLPENVNKSTKIVVGNINDPAVTMGNVNKSSTPSLANTNKPTTTVAGSVNRYSTIIVGNVNKHIIVGNNVNKSSIAAVGSAVSAANKSQLAEGENASKPLSTTVENVNKSAITSEIVKCPVTALVENENRSVSITTGNIARIQPQQITNINKSEGQINVPFTKTVDRITPDIMPLLQTGPSQGGMESMGNATHMIGAMTRPKVQIIFPTVKTAEKLLPDAVPILEDNLLENELVVKPMINSLKSQVECIANVVKSKGQLNLTNVEIARQTIPDEICNSIQEKDLPKCELSKIQSDSRIEPREVLKPDENASEVEQNFPSAIEEMPSVISDLRKEEAISVRKEETIEIVKNEECENAIQNLYKVDDRNIPVEELAILECTSIKSTEADSTCSSNKDDCLVTSINSDLEKENDVKCAISTEENTKEASEQATKVICDDTVVADMRDELTTRLSFEESNTQQNEEAGGFDRTFETTTNVICDSEILSTSNVSETKFPQSIRSETIHERKETSMDIESECNLKLSTDSEATSAFESSDVEASAMKVHPECKAEQINDEISCEETDMNVECEILDNNGSLNYTESVALPSAVSALSLGKNKCEIDRGIAVTNYSKTETHSSNPVGPVTSLHSVNDDIPVTIKSISLEGTHTMSPSKSKQEQAETNMEVDPDDGLHSDDKAHCIAEDSTLESEFIKNASEDSLGQETVDQHSHYVRKMDTNINAESSNLCFNTEVLDVSNVTEEAESMEVDPDNGLHSDDATQHIIKSSEASITEVVSTNKLEENSIEQSSYGRGEKVNMSSDNFRVEIETLSKEEVKNKPEQQITIEVLDNNREAAANIDTESESKSRLSYDIELVNEANTAEFKDEQKFSSIPFKKEGLNDDKYILCSSENEIVDTTESAEGTDVIIPILKASLLESNQETTHSTEREVDLTVKTETLISATESIVMKDKIEETSLSSKNEQPNDVASNKTEVNSSCDQPDPGFSCDEEALNLNEDTVEFYESLSPKEHIPENTGQIGIDNLSNLITFTKRETIQSENLENGKDKNAEADNISAVTTKTVDNIKLVKEAGQEICSSTKIISILDNPPESKQVEVDTEIKVTSSPQEETAEEMETAGLVIPVGLSPTQQAEDKSDDHCQEEKIITQSVQSTFGLDDADATIQALENLLEETKQLQSPVAKTSVNKETTVVVEENAKADLEQKSE